MSKRSAKKVRSTVLVRGLDAQNLELMMRLHYETCRQRARDANEYCWAARQKGDTEEEARCRKVERNWDRAARKAWSYAEQFEQVKLDCYHSYDNGYLAPQVRRLI